jgi:hypothetical protein
MEGKKKNRKNQHYLNKRYVFYVPYVFYVVKNII